MFLLYTQFLVTLLLAQTKRRQGVKNTSTDPKVYMNFCEDRKERE